MRDPIANAKELIQDYITENNKRIGFTKNKSRDELFTELQSNIDDIEARRDLLFVEKLEVIRAYLDTAEVNNNTLDRSVEHTGKSTEAIRSASNIILRAIVVATRAEADAAVQASIEAQRQTDAAAIIDNPIATIQNKILAGKIDELNAEEIVPGMAALIQERSRSALTDSQKIFYHDLNQELINRKLPVGEGVLNLIVRSSLADRYATLFHDYGTLKSKASELALRKMIQTVSKIVLMCLTNTNSSVHDIHHLFIARDENKLLEVLTLMHGKRMLSLASTRHNEPTTQFSDNGQRVSAFPSILTQLEPIGGKLDMAKLHDGIGQLMPTNESRRPDGCNIASGAAAASPLAENVTHVDIIASASQHLYCCVNLSTTLSHLIEAITVNSQTLMSLTHGVATQQRHDQLRIIAD
ncbi:MAG: hypothetical protein A3C44_03605 [Gammaproteobacteria bacterium RIFCSPHIGHO2_02_FULL_39_13]|nr:MAG: hypothetical protein A3C44_03605 [Gammaproteobacteria bacterium RIFCSPHIGHO2_02_FULL_39_13]OGT49463.1 MAG: hypothetical protein A3E53_02585 [Gammaproteobacteria bacterium RIFCSPHIGHO2_12_FULL_39_24]